MAKHIWLVSYAVGETLEEKEVKADYYDLEDGAFVTFHEDNDAGTGAGGAVFSVLAELVVTVERAAER